VKERGITLMMTMWVLVLLSAVALDFALSARYESAGTRNFKEDARAYYLAVSTCEEAMAYIISDKDTVVDFIDSEGNYRTDAERPPITGERKLDGATVTLSITDEESRVNINTLSANSILRLLLYVGVEDDNASELADSVADWKDPDGLHRLMGAEDEYYEPLGYRAKNDNLDVPEELLLIKGFSPEHFHGRDNAPSLREFITTWGRGINVNTASKDMLMALGLSEIEADSIISRREDSEGLRSVPARLKGIGTTSSENIRIEAVARINDSPQAVKVTSIIKRSGENGLITLYWKEDVETSGT
jgi:general secretion pathway protein K